MNYRKTKQLLSGATAINQNKGAMVIGGAAGTISFIVDGPNGATVLFPAIATGVTSCTIFPLHINGWTGTSSLSVYEIF